MTARWPTYAIGAVIVGTAGLLYYAFSLPVPERDLFLEEGGPVEMASALLYFVAAGLVGWFAGTEWRDFLPEIITFLGLGAREFDLDDLYFTNGLMKPNQYFGPEVALPEKLISAVILFILAWAALTVLRRYLPSLLREHRAGNRAATAGLVTAIYIVVAELLDTPSRKIEVFGIPPTPGMDHFALWIEESIELGIPLLLIIAVVAGMSARRQQGAQAIQTHHPQQTKR